MVGGDDFDITGNIKAIEKLKYELLAGITDLYGGLLMSDSNSAQRAEILSNIVIMTYLLSSRLGISYYALDTKVLSKLKLGILEDNNILFPELSALYKYIDKNRS